MRGIKGGWREWGVLLLAAGLTVSTPPFINAAEDSTQPRASITSQWDPGWNARLDQAAETAIKGKAAKAHGTSALTLVYSSASKLAKSPAASVPKLAEYGEAVLLRTSQASRKQLDSAEISYKVFPTPRRVGHELLAFNSASQTVSFPKALPESAEAHDGHKIHWIQFQGPVHSDWLDNLKEQGVKPLTPYPDFCYLVWASDQEIASLQKSSEIVWTGEFAPGFKLSREIAAPYFLKDRASFPKTPVELYICAVTSGKANESVFKALSAAGAKIDLRSELDFYEAARVTVAASKVPEIAAMAGVLSIEPYFHPEPEDERSAQIAAGNYNGSNVPVTGYNAWLSGLQATGDGVTVGIVDNGIEDTHGDIQGRVVSIDYGTGSAGEGHGHHVGSIVAGNAAIGTTDGDGFLYGQGMAPDANLIDQPYLKSGSSATYEELVRDTVTTQGPNGATGYIQNNSWGGGADNPPGSNTTYQSVERAYDLFVRDADDQTAGNQPLMICFSAGNSGDDKGCPAPAETLTRPKAAKNVFVTGATNNLRSGSTYSNNIEDLAVFSSRGPASDGRIKPDVCMPGTYISGARTDGYTGWSAIDTDYVFVGGTSQASPHSAGAAALLAEWWKDNNGGTLPSPAMLKALLIQSASDMSSSGDSIGGCTISSFEDTMAPIPNIHEGWGRAKIDDVLESPTPMEFVDQTTLFTSSGDTFSVVRSIADTANPVKITLAWTDAPGAIGANPALVNDLDLEIRLNGNTYYGNVLSSGQSLPGGSRDSINIVERVILPAGESGRAEITVRAANLAGDGVPGNGTAIDQDFALVLQNVEELGPAGSVGLPAFISCSGPLEVQLADSDLSGQGTASVTVTTSGGDTETATLSEQDAPSGIFEGTIDVATGTPAADNQTLEVADGETVTVTYQDADDGTGNPATAEEEITVDCAVPQIINPTINGIGAVSATLTFSTNEPSRVLIEYGTSCGSPSESIQLPLDTQFSRELTNLEPGTGYFLRITATDQADNVATDDNGGSCYTFTTDEQKAYFTETFTQGDNDLAGLSLLLTPDASLSEYNACLDAITELPTDPSSGTDLGLGDDAFAEFPISGEQVTLYGQNYNSIYINSNGNITFDNGDTEFSESLSDHFAAPRVSALWDDYSPDQSGSVLVEQLSDRVVATWLNVPQYNAGDANTFQAELYFDGKIKLSWLDVGSSDGLSGLSKGNGLPLDFLENDLSNFPECALVDGWPVGDFNDSGCTDVQDFLFMLDHWQESVGENFMDLDDFLNLLDNWQTGPGC